MTRTFRQCGETTLLGENCELCTALSALCMEVIRTKFYRVIGSFLIGPKAHGEDTKLGVILRPKVSNHFAGHTTLSETCL